MVYRILAVMMVFPMLYDWFTSLIGAIAFFGLNSESPVYMWGIPICLSIGALALNIGTVELLGSPGTHRVIRLVWFMFILFDFYTTLLGLGNSKLGGGMFSLKTTSVLAIIRGMSLEETLILAVTAIAFVASPMLFLVFWEKRAQLR